MSNDNIIPEIDPEELTAERQKKIRWVEVEVTVACKSGPKILRGLRHTTQGAGLAVTMLQYGQFDVTHMASGLAISKGWERCVNAMLALLELAPLADWTQDEAGVRAEAHRRAKAGEMVQQFGGAQPVSYSMAMTAARGLPWADEFPVEDDDTSPWALLEHWQVALDRVAPSPTPPSHP